MTMRGYFGVTDPGWYEHLSRTPGPKDANFWRPSTRAYRLPIGTPFMFKLKAPHHAIAGFGFFAGFTILPDWLAWNTFGDANGVGSLSELRNRLTAIREGARIHADPQGRIGCALVAEARFVPSRRMGPSAEGLETANPERRELRSVDGRRRASLERMRCSWRNHGPRCSPIRRRGHRARFGAPVVYRPRLGQGIFRVQVLDEYSRACAVTGEHTLPVLEVAHIRPYADGGEHDITNGLALRTDIHRLFDTGYVCVDDDLRLIVGRRLEGGLLERALVLRSPWHEVGVAPEPERSTVAFRLDVASRARLPRVALSISSNRTAPSADRTVMTPNLAVHTLSEDHLVVELNERLTEPGPALELHLVRDSETGASTAWWEDDAGSCLAVAAVGCG